MRLKITDAELENMAASGMKQKDIAAKIGMDPASVCVRFKKIKIAKEESIKNKECAMKLQRFQRVEYAGKHYTVHYIIDGIIALKDSQGTLVQIKESEYELICGILVEKGALQKPAEKPEIKTYEDKAVEQIIEEIKAEDPEPEEEPSIWADIIERIEQTIKLTPEEEKMAIEEAARIKQKLFLRTLASQLDKRIGELVS